MGVKNNGNNGVNVNYNISYVLIGLVFILIIGFCIFYFLFYNENKDITILDVMAFFTGSVAILTLIYHSLGLESNSRFHKEKLRIQKNQFSYEIAERFNGPDMKGISIISELRNTKASELEEKNIKKFMEYLKNNPKKRVILMKLLNYYEHISVMVKNNHVEEEIIKSYFKSVFISNYSLLKFYIDERQLTNRRSWINFEELANKWREQK